MKRWFPITSICFLLGLLAWHPFFKTNLNAQSSVKTKPKPTAQSAASPLGDFKALFFADQSLEEITQKPVMTSREPADCPWSLFASALAKSRNGKLEDARKDVKRVLANPDVEVRMRLWAWKALRELGERPPANIANEVQGVVCELHNEAGVGTIAAYADGRARWLGGKGKITVWEAPDSDAEIAGLIRTLLRSAEPLVKTATVLDRHKASEPELNYFRVSILTYAGIYIVEVYGPEIDRQHAVAPLLIGSVNLLDALSKKSEDAGERSR